MKYLIIFAFVFLASVLLIRLALKIFPRLGLLDNPVKYGLTRKPIPYYGGLLVFAVFLFFVLILLRVDVKILIVLAAAGLLVFISFLDDKFGVRPEIRLFVQLAAALGLILSGIYIDAIRSPFGGLLLLDSFKVSFSFNQVSHQISIISVLVTIIWIIVMTNTINWMDGVNGMASGISFIAFIILFFLSVRPDIHHINQSNVAIMSIILAAVSLAFAYFEFYPAKILMGDTGSMFLGFMIAVLAIFSGGKVATAFLVMGFPILDAIWVAMRRLLSGKNPMRGDLHHFYHRLIAVGFSQRATLIIMYCICFVFGLTALLLDDAYSKGIAISAMILIMFFIALWLVKKDHSSL